MNFEDFEGTSSIVDRFERMINEKRSEFFDIHELEAMVEYYMVSTNWKRALLCADYGLKLHPNSTELLNIKGQALTAGNRLKEAKQVLERLRELDPINPEMYMSLGSLYWKLERKALSQKMYKHAMKLDENLTFDVCSILVQQYLMENQPLDALPYLVELIEWDTNDDYALELIVDIFVDLEMVDQGDDLFEMLSKKEPDNAFLLYYRALLLGNSKQLSKATYLLEKARKLKDSDLEYDIFLLLGKLYYDQEEFQKAQKMTRKAYDLEIADESARLMAEIEMKIGNYHSALDYAEKAYFFDKEDLNNIFTLASAHVYLNNMEKAAKLFRKYGKLALPEDYRLKAVSSALYELGQPNEAMRIFEKSILQDSPVPEKSFQDLIEFCAISEEYDRVIKHTRSAIAEHGFQAHFIGHLIGAYILTDNTEAVLTIIEHLDKKDYRFVFDIFERYYTEVVEFDRYLGFIQKHMGYGQ
jgi:tetratricopeptide (TPR) repeat protein